MKKLYPSILQMKPFASAAGLVAALFFSSHSAVAQPVIGNLFPNGSSQFQSTNELTFSATSTPGVTGVSVTLTATTLFGVQEFPQTLTSSSGLTIGGNANSETVTAPLQTNVLYTAQIIVTDSNGSTTNNDSFDTISPYYTWEAIDWDYISNGIDGLYIDNPQVNQYVGRASTDGVDFHSTNPGQGNSQYRPQGLETEGPADVPRPQYVGTTNIDYDVGYNNGGNWANYTRHYPSGFYNVFVRASDGNNAQNNAGDISVVAGTAAFTNSGPYYFSTKSTGWSTYAFYPLIDSTGKAAEIFIPNDGTASTLRMTIDGGNCNENFFMLIPVNTNAPVVGEGFVTNTFPNGAYEFQQTNTFTGSVMSPNGIQTIVAQVSGTRLSGGTFSQTLTASSGLTISGVSTNENISFALTTDAVYSVTFLITDGAGNGSTATASFDTINPNYYTWEAPDYDYSGGNYFDNPQTNAYWGLPGDANIDAFNPNGVSGAEAYGPRAVGPPYAGDQGDLNIDGPNNDQPLRVQYLSGAINPNTLVAYQDFNLGYTGGGQWANYTRHYPAGIYNIYVKVADGGGATSDAGNLSLVTSGYQSSSQTLSQIGTFNAPATGGWNTYAFVPLLNSGGYPARFIGTNGVLQTLRMTLVNANCNVHFYMLVPANLNNNPPPFVSSFTPDGTAIFQPSNTVNFVANSSVGIATSGIQLYLNGVLQSGLTFGGNSFATTVSCPIQANQSYTAIIKLSDSVGTVYLTNSFATFSAADYQLEAEDYDYSGGQFFDNPQTNAYLGLAASQNIDIFESDTNAFARASGAPYRPANDIDFPDMTSGDLSRAQFSSGGTDYAVGSFGTNSWANYTRHYPVGTYNIVGRFAEGAAASQVNMSLLTSGYATSTQTVSLLGTFNVPLGGWSSYEWVTLKDAHGNPAKVTFDGTRQTLQAEGTNPNEVNMNFFLLAPTAPYVKVSTSLSAGNIRLTFLTQTGYNYQVVYTTNLANPTWTPLGSALTGNNAYQTVGDTLSSSHRFYQVQITP